MSSRNQRDLGLGERLRRVGETHNTRVTPAGDTHRQCLRMAFPGEKEELRMQKLVAGWILGIAALSAGSSTAMATTAETTSAGEMTSSGAATATDHPTSTSEAAVAPGHEMPAQPAHGEPQGHAESDSHTSKDADHGAHAAADPAPHAHAADAGATDHHAAAHHSIHANHLALFAGATLAESALHPSIGLEYERRLPAYHSLIGLTAFVEAVPAEALEVLAGGGVVVHPFKNLRLLAMAGVAIIAPSSSGTEESSGDEHRASPNAAPLRTSPAEAAAEGTTEVVSLARAGVAYDLHVGKLTLSPSVFADYAHAHLTWVGGLGIGFGF